MGNIVRKGTIKNGKSKDADELFDGIVIIILLILHCAFVYAGFGAFILHCILH